MRTATLQMTNPRRRSRSHPFAERQIRLERYVYFLHQSMLCDRPPAIATVDAQHSARWEKQLSRQLF